MNYTKTNRDRTAQIVEGHASFQALYLFTN